jgi:release factor glutamine methyltransferase
VLGLTRAELLARPDRALPPAAKHRLSRLLHRRARREPLQYLIGETDFRTLTLRCTPAALVPRPETEGLVELVLRALPPAETGPVLDVGTGTGCIALSLAAERPRLRVWATDLSPAALRLARQNARRTRLTGRVVFREGDLTAPFDGHRGELAAVASNPPYVARAERKILPPEVRDHEPELALFAPGHGLATIRRLVRRAARLLRPGGLLALEIGEGQGPAVRALLTRRNGWRHARIERDLAGRDRYALAERG